jgi:hypothetical protein
MNGFDVGISGKVVLVECENMSDAVHPHSSDQSRVVDLNARDIVGHEQLAPLMVDRRTIGKQTQIFFKKLRASISLGRSQPLSVAIKRAGAGIPEFCNVLGRIAECSATLQNGIDR